MGMEGGIGLQEATLRIRPCESARYTFEAENHNKVKGDLTFFFGLSFIMLLNIQIFFNRLLMSV